VKWWRLAAVQGDTVAQNSLANAYAFGVGVPEDYMRAQMWLNLSAAILRGEGEDAQSVTSDQRASITTLLRRVSEKLTPAQMERAQEMARECQASNFKNCD